MKKTVILGVSLCLLLTGCVPKSEMEADSGTSSSALSVQVAEEKAAYYKQLASDLQQELLSVRAEYYEKSAEYEARIAALEEKLDETANGEEHSGDADVDAPTEEHSDFQFQIENGKATLTAYVGKDTEVVIPSSFEGCPVTSIADRAFENCIKLESVTVPNGVVTVGWFAFSGCVHLSSVTLPDSVRSISYGAFLNCNSKMTISCSADSYAAAYAASYGIEVKR
ncbi:MAG: leucine-rich repeat domain-containing protein [Clostridia bacterium]|nr:leucine-rich repeat domain-containing protein [Clostridia bacterium]